MTQKAVEPMGRGQVESAPEIEQQRADLVPRSLHANLDITDMSQFDKNLRLRSNRSQFHFKTIFAIGVGEGRSRFIVAAMVSRSARKNRCFEG